MKRQGFTLIELLVVIAIIGILVALVLTGVGMARSKAKDNAIRNDVRQMRIMAEEVYDASGASYLDWSSDAEIIDRLDTLHADVNKQHGSATNVTRICDTQTKDFCISAEFTAEPGHYFCIDATGRYLETTTPCPETCPDDTGSPLRCE